MMLLSHYPISYQHCPQHPHITYQQLINKLSTLLTYLSTASPNPILTFIFSYYHIVVTPYVVCIQSYYQHQHHHLITQLLHHNTIQYIPYILSTTSTYHILAIYCHIHIYYLYYSHCILPY